MEQIIGYALFFGVLFLLVWKLVGPTKRRGVLSKGQDLPQNWIDILKSDLPCNALQ